jgi:hypothetical protein
MDKRRENPGGAAHACFPALPWKVAGSAACETILNKGV